MLLFLIAMAPAQPGGQSSGGGGLAAWLPMIAIFVILWLLILRPQQKRQKEHQKMLQTLDKGDKVVTSGGIHGQIVRVNPKERTMVIKTADDTKLTIDIGAVGRRQEESLEAKG